LTTYISQGSVATDLTGGGSYNSVFLCRSFLNLTVKKLWKLVHVCRSYHKNKSGTYFWIHGVDINKRKEIYCISLWLYLAE